MFFRILHDLLFKALFGALPGIIALIGVFAVAWAQSNDHDIQEREINSMCTTVCYIYKYIIGAEDLMKSVFVTIHYIG